MEISKGLWKPGKPWGTIVTEDGSGFPEQSQESLDFYGGNLIAESIAKESDRNLMMAAPDLLKALLEIIPFASVMINDNHPAKQQANRAIEKATGTAPIPE